jgi:hypothetical protein
MTPMNNTLLADHFKRIDSLIGKLTMEAFPGQAAYVLSLTKEALRVRAAEDSTKVTPGCPPLFMEDFETFFFLCECVVLGLELRAYTLPLHHTFL